MEESCLAVGRSNDEQKQGQLETHRTWCYTGLPDKKEKNNKLFKYFFLFARSQKKKTNKTVFTLSLVSAIFFQPPIILSLLSPTQSVEKNPN